MDIDAKRKTSAILRVLADAGSPLGSTHIADELQLLGIDLKQRMVRNYLQQMDEAGLTENLGRAGRRITDRGREELDTAVVIDKVGFISAKVDELAYQMSFDPNLRTGTVILNVSTIPASEITRAQKLVNAVLEAGLGMGKFVAVGGAGEELGGHPVPRGRIAIGTVCTVTLNGVLRGAGIPMRSRFGGLLQVQEGEPLRFTQIINYDGTTLDPVEIFIKGKMTRVMDAVKKGAGTVGASFREVPAAALPATQRVIERLERVGLGGVLCVGRPGRPLLDVPVPHGCVGIIVAAGLNALAAVEEAGIETESHAMASLHEFDDLVPAAEMSEALER